MSPAHRRKISEGQRRRWAMRKKHYRRPRATRTVPTVAAKHITRAMASLGKAFRALDRL